MGAAAARLRRRGREVRRVRRDCGPGAVAFMVARRALRLVGVRVEWIRILEQRPGTAAVPGRDPIPPTWVAPDDPGVLTAFGRSPDVVRRRLDAGGRAAVVTDADGLVAQLWIHPGAEYDEEGVRFRLAPDEAWVFDGVVSESRRGERIYPRLAVGVAHDLEADGVARLLSTIDALNVPSLRAARVRGCTVLGAVLVVRAWGLGALRVHWRGRPARWHAFRGSILLTPPPSPRATAPARTA